MRLLLPALLCLSGIAAARRREPVKDLSHANLFPELDVGAAHIFAVENGTSPALSNIFFSGEDTPCGPNKPCSDGSCCNANGFCGYGKDYCSKDEPTKCQSNCDAKAKCGKDSPDGKVKCALNLCCSDYGYCGTAEDYCDANNKDHPCQKDFGGCEVRKPPSCGKDSNTATGGRRMGYYASWNVRNRNCNRIWPKHLEAETFTHITFAFASIDPQTFKIVPADPGDVNLYEQFTNKKSATLQIWIAVGGWDFSEPNTPTRETWSKLAESPANRATFVVSARLFLEKYGFQGLDIDWEYPSASDRGGRPQDKENFIKLLEEMRAVFGSKFGISVAIPASFPYLQGFDLKPMEQYVDWFNLMSYDLHGLWDANYEGLGPYMLPHTSLTELDRMLLPFWFTTVDPKKVNMGMARYGRGYTVKDKSCMNIGCEFAGGNKAGNCTNVPSSLSNEEIRRIINEKGLETEFVKDHGVKIARWDDQWIAFDDYETFELRKDFANDKCFGGVFIWTIDYTGRGSGNRPNIDRDPTGENLEGQHFDSDTFLHPDIWKQPKPRLECIPPCTLMLPPFVLPTKTTITWPPFETTFLSIGGGQTGTSVKEKSTMVSGVITKVTETVITVEGATINTITSKISVPAFITDRIHFHPVTVEQTDSAGAEIQPVPSITPPSLMLELPPGVRTFPPTPFSYEGEAPPPSRTQASTPMWFSFGTTSRKWTIQPQPTVPIELPKNSTEGCHSDGENSDDEECDHPIFPVLATFQPVPPKKTCDIPALCGHKDCAAFGCGCGPLGLPVGPGCNTGCKGSILNDLLGVCNDHDSDDSDQEQDNRNHNDDQDDRKKRDKKKDEDKDEEDGKEKDDDDEKDRDDDDEESGGEDDEDEERYRGDSGRKPKDVGPPKPKPKPNPTAKPTDPPKSKPSPPPPESTSIGGNCGKFGCDGGCGPYGCGGGCGVQGCGHKCIGGNCVTCPLDKCGGPECQNGGCSFPPTYPKGNPKGGCDKDKQTQVTDYFISCTRFDETSSSCKTTWSAIHTGCGITGTKSTTKKGPSCTRVPLNLDDDQGDDNGQPPEGDRPSKTESSKEEKPTPTGDPDWMKRKCEAGFCGCCLDYYWWCKTMATDCHNGKHHSFECIQTCLHNMCYSDDSPQACHKGQWCGDQIEMCPDRKKRSESELKQLDAKMAGMKWRGPAYNPAVPTPT